jgi:hypothetical protein
LGEAGVQGLADFGDLSRYALSVEGGDCVDWLAFSGQFFGDHLTFRSEGLTLIG